ncbi:MAG: methyl-accepting chemotaxis protein [Planctomycetes bacterium]|nr:methyl-accepting chemotaxis protein [Planctomycetota bacterium]
MFSRLGIRGKLLGLGVILTLAPLLVVASVVYRQNTKMSDVAATRTVELAQRGLDDIGRGVYSMCLAQQQLLQQNVSATLNVARAQMRGVGEVRFAEETVTWAAVNQYTKSSRNVDLPKMLAGDTWLGQNRDMAAESPVVDATAGLVGGTCTIFQRMNEAGDMLRVCTNVQGVDKNRAIGTYIPAVNPDGTPNPVVAKVLQKETFTGRAFVVDQWYITAYEPIRDAADKVVGMLYVGVKQESTPYLRQQIMKLQVGETGYVYVLDSKGTYVISKDGKRDGEVIWDSKDADGKYFIREVCQKAAALREGELDTVHYAWKNPEDPAARTKIVRVIYFQPWDWVVGVGSYEDEFRQAEREVTDIGRFGNILLGIITLAAVVISCLLWAFVAGRLSGKISRIVAMLTDGAEQTAAAAGEVSASSQSLAEGSSEQAASLEETSSSIEEMSSMTKQNAANAKEANALSTETLEASERGTEAVQRMSDAIGKIKASSDETARIIKVIDEIAFQTNLLALNAAVEAARAGEAGKGFAVVAEEVRNLAQRSAEAAKNTQQLIDESQKNADDGVKVTENVTNALGEIAGGAKKVSDLLGEVAAASDEQARGIGEINAAVGQMDQVTQQVAANAEESAAASEELSAQAEQLNQIVADLAQIVGGSRASQRDTSSQAASRRARQPVASSGYQSKLGRKPSEASQKSERKAARSATSHSSSAAKSRKAEADEVIPLDEAEEATLAEF